MPVEAIVIAILSGAALVAGLIAFFVINSRLEFPSGKMKKKKGDGINLKVIFEGVEPDKDFVDAAHSALRAVRDTWKKEFPDEAKETDEDFKRFAVLTSSDEEFNKMGDDNWKKKINGTIGYVSRLMGYDVPMVMMRAKYNNKVKQDGGLVVHESLHLLAGPYHSNDRIWQGGEVDDDSIESKAKRLAVKYIS